MSRTVGFIGLGNMGYPMAMRLVKAGFQVVACDQSEANLERAVQGGASPARSIAAVAEADRIICMVGTTAQTEEVLFGSHGVAAARRGSVVLCMNTIEPSAARRFSVRLADRGIAMLDAPVSGGTPRAAAGTLVVMAGGDAGIFESCRDIFAAIGNEWRLVGPAGSGMAMKLVNNMLAQINIVAVCEAFVLAERAGLDLELMCEIVRAGTGDSAAFRGRDRRLLARDFVPGGSVDICLKDQELQTAFARELGMPLMVASLTKQIYQAAHAAGYGSEDAGAVIKVFEAMAGKGVRGTGAAG